MDARQSVNIYLIKENGLLWKAIKVQRARGSYAKPALGKLSRSASTEQGLVASERQSAPAHLPDEDGEQGDRDTSAQATHERSKCQFWKLPVPPSWRPLYVDEGPGISLSGRGWRGDSLHRKLQGDCHTQMPWLRASMLQQSLREVRWCCFITLIYPVLHP